MSSLLSLFLFPGGMVLATDDVDHSEAAVERRGSALFNVRVPGETYDEISGSIGHRSTDMTLSGNSLLDFNLTRKYEEIPESYPFALGTMSFVVPTLTFDTLFSGNRDVPPENLHCDTWANEKNPGATAKNVHDGMKFTHEAGTTTLQIRDLAKPAFQARFPEEALYMSPDYHYLVCENGRFVIHAPTGVKYVFEAKATERTYNTRLIGYARNAEPSQVSNYHTFKMHAVAKRRLTTHIRYSYEPTPVPNAKVGDEMSRHHEAAPPLVPEESAIWRQGTTFQKSHVNKAIEQKLRLSKVTLVVWGQPDRSIDLHYRGSSAGTECPGLVDRAESNHTRNIRVN